MNAPHPPIATARTETNMPWAVYRCPRLGLGQAPTNEEFVSGHLTPSEAYTEACRLKRSDRHHSYVVGAA